ncbi:MAG: hypothetical protein ACRDZ4_08405 [Egibacteraceae bacterium]
MIPVDEAAAAGRESLTLVPENTFVTYREKVKGGQLINRENAYNTGRVKVLTTENQERDFPREGGLPFDAERERKMSYRTRAEAYKFEPYGADKPVIGARMWPAKQLFPLTPDIERVDSVEHDILPSSRETSRKDSVVQGTDSDTERGFVPARDMKGDLGMLYGLGEEAYNYGNPDGSAGNVDQEDLLTLVAWDQQNADWQLGAKQGKTKPGHLVKCVSVWAHRVAQATLQRAKAGKFKNAAEALAWAKAKHQAAEMKKVAAPGVLVFAGNQAFAKILPELQRIFGSATHGGRLKDYLEGWPDTQEFMHLDSGTWGRSGHEFTGLGQDDWRKSLVTSLDQDPGAAAAVTNAATQAVAQGVKTGAVPSDAASIANAIAQAANAAASLYSTAVGQKKPVPPAGNMVQRIGAAILPSDQPFYKQPLFWGGVGLLTIAVGAMALKGGGKRGTRRRSTTRRYRRNTFPTFNKKRSGWRSRWK